MSTDNKEYDANKETSPPPINNSTSISSKNIDIEKQLDQFIAKNNYKSKVGHWLRDISPTSSPRSIIEKYYNENNPFALDEWTLHWGIDTSKCFSSLWNTQSTYTPENNKYGMKYIYIH